MASIINRNGKYYYKENEVLIEITKTAENGSLIVPQSKIRYVMPWRIPTEGEYILPEPPVLRKWNEIVTVESKHGKWTDYMTDEEKHLLEDTIEKARKNLEDRSKGIK